MAARSRKRFQYHQGKRDYELEGSLVGRRGMSLSGKDREGKANVGNDENKNQKRDSGELS